MEAGQISETGAPVVWHVEMALKLEQEPVVNQSHSSEGNNAKATTQKLRVASTLIAVSWHCVGFYISNFLQAE